MILPTRLRIRFRAAGLLAAAIPLLVTATGCATKGYVRTQVATADARIDSVDGRVGQVQADLQDVRDRADQAYERATLAERLANGQVDYTEVSSSAVQFAFDDWRLDADAQAVLDDLANRLASHPSYVLEIRGYADAVGPQRYNYHLGRERAESVERYLASQHAVPLARVAVLTYGEDDPVADNGSSAGRAENRRVVVRLLDLKRTPSDQPLAAQR